MRKMSTKKIDCASEYIIALQSLMQKPALTNKELELGLIQQFLDDEALNIKQIPRDSFNIFRVFADVLKFSQCQYKILLNSYLNALDENSEIHELSTLLIMMTTMTTQMYANNIRNGYKSKPEVDAILMAMFFDIELKLYYVAESGLGKQECLFHIGESKSTKPLIQLYLAPDGYFDVIYSKVFIKSAGVCQSLLLDIFDSIFATEREQTKLKQHAPVYQNFEYQIWKARATEAMLKPTADNELKIAFSSANEDPSWMKDKESPTSNRRRNVSDTSVGTPTLRKEIRSYMSSVQISSPPQSKFVPSKKSGATPQTRTDFKKDLAPPPTITLTSGYTEPKLPDSFGSYMDAYKGYYVPQQMSNPYANQYYPQMAVTPQPPPCLYPQASYVPVYIPVIMPQTFPTPSYAYPPSSNSEVLTGKVKFFDSTQNYGFFTLDLNGSDLFVHYDDFLKVGITKEYIQMAKAMNVKFAFRKVNYYGKYSLSSKAVDIQIIQDQVLPQ